MVGNMIRKIKSTIKNLVLAISEKSIVARKVIRSTFDLYRKIKYKIVEKVMFNNLINFIICLQS